jgi:UDP-2-acetamido-2,6-beta-L-arabino-hexul-4-ose reductase
MKMAVTGADGFLGWHIRCRAFALGHTCVPIGRALMDDDDGLLAALRGVEAVLHCAGVNRGTDAEVTEGNLVPARQLLDAVRRSPQAIRVVFANSVHCHGDSAYGIAKRQIAELFRESMSTVESFSDVVLPNLFGEHGRPWYNSFVATFCHELAHGREPERVSDREIRLLHAQDAADIMIHEAYASGPTVVSPDGEPTSVRQVLRTLRDFELEYRDGQLPDISTPFRARLFNTYRSHLFPAQYPIYTKPRTDIRGTLVEGVRTGRAGGQAFISSTTPGSTRGDHVHLRKFERFLVVDGEAEIRLRRLFSEEIVRFTVTGAQPAAVDMPTMWAHSITNLGRAPLTTFFWSNELYSADDPDTFGCPVDDRRDAA